LARLIINADDFGLTRGVNQAIVEAHKNGVVTSATMMANGAALDDALLQSHAAPSLAVGCHVVLVDGTPVLPPEQVPDLLEPGTGHFHRTLSHFLMLAVRRRIAPDQIEAEATAQIQKLQSAGIRPSHVDTHKHTHMFPQVLDPLLRAVRACDVQAIRNPFEQIRIALLKQGPRIYKRWIEVKALRTFLSHFARAVKQAGLSTTEGTVGIAATGILQPELFNIMANQIPEGTWEFVCHPGYNDSDLRQTSTRLLESRVRELEILTSSSTREALEKRGIQLISYRDVPVVP
jgi:hopanoid biosynthesis associated protein HpnK